MNIQGTLLASAARTATNATGFQNNEEYRGGHIIIDVTAVTGSPSLTFTVQGLDRTSGKTYTILASSALATTGTTVLKVYPGLTPSANAAANDVLPQDWRVNVTHGTADSVTYSVGFSAVN